ncbi:alpha/beta fold hydrolase [Cohaesibacter gelatinilyticus]|uniref:Haloacetate dehalogenase n=1 Tax=Cohaesibacter gelatinilyticus TaxID=372072 RepID=A0A285N7E5_9HYPH|nr:alpha/beta hydrolase [Cohaesibacter gelatinilyticus]SNZ05395.1 haloacetate dehalogenase [Cohaesibacter gelatinilyticus]
MSNHSDYAALKDMFPGFETRTIQVGSQELFLRVGGSGPVLLLIHGYPQNHVCWHKIAPILAEHFTLILPDLPGYGRSSHPEDDENFLNHSKRAMASSLVQLMEELEHERFLVAGHDRGARVAYRMALDHSDKVEKLVCLDITPTLDMWQGMNAPKAMNAYHWQFLAQPYPLPEKLIMADPAYYLDHTIASWAKSRDLSAFDPKAMDHYRATFATEEQVHGACQDYRAGWAIDQELDARDREEGRKIKAPTLVISGPASKTSDSKAQQRLWEQWCENIDCQTVSAGHFVAEEAPSETLDLLLPFLKS